jgi:hypothetical protein
MDFLHDLRNFDFLMWTITVVAFGMFLVMTLGPAYLIARYVFPLMDWLHDRFTSRKA